jgi:hypothetical protein
LLSEKPPQAGLLRAQTKKNLQFFFVCALFGYKSFDFVQSNSSLTYALFNH